MFADVGGGVGYNKRTNNELSHPHQEQWVQWKAEFTSLVSDGVWFTRVAVADNIKPLSFSKISPSRRNLIPEVVVHELTIVVCVCSRAG